MSPSQRSNGGHHPSTALFLFNKIPIRDNYKDTRDQAVKLKAPIEITRGCFLFEIAVFVTSFIIFFYFAYRTVTIETTITYEPLGGSYDCQILSPLSSGVSLSTTYSEIAMYSSARYTYDTCITKLGTSGLDVCSDDHRLDYFLTANGAATDDSNCYDIILASNYRFCYLTDASSYNSGFNTDQFPTYPSISFPYTDLFVFTNESGLIKPLTTSFSFSDILSDIISDGLYTVYLCAKPSGAGSTGKQYLYALSAETGQAREIVEITISNYYGFTFGNGYLYAYTISGYDGQIHQIDTESGVDTIKVVNCQDYTSSAVTGSDTSSYRYIDYGDDDYLYVMCTGDTFKASSTGSGPVTIESTTYAFMKVDPNTFEVTPMYADIYNVNATLKSGEDSGKPLTSVSQILVRSNVAYAYCGGSQANIVAIDYTPAPPTLYPTLQPSNEPNYGFSLSQGLVGISASTFNQNLATNSKLFKITVAAVLKYINESAVTINSISDGTVSSHTHRRRNRNSHDALTVGCVVDYTVMFTQSQVPQFQNASVAYSNLTSSLTDSLDNGKFSELLQSNAANTDVASSWSSVTSTEVIVSTIEILSVPSAMPTSTLRPTTAGTSGGSSGSSSGGSGGGNQPTSQGGGASNQPAGASPSAVPSVGGSSASSSHPTGQGSPASSGQQQSGSAAPTSPAPSYCPSIIPSALPSVNPSMVPSVAPSFGPTNYPGTAPPSESPTAGPTLVSEYPTTVPTQLPTTIEPTVVPSRAPTVSLMPVPSPSISPTNQAMGSSGPSPGGSPGGMPPPPSQAPTLTNPQGPDMTYGPTPGGSQAPTTNPSRTPSETPTLSPTSVKPSVSPTVSPTLVPSMVPSASPSSAVPSDLPSANPSVIPSISPTLTPSAVPSTGPTIGPTVSPTSSAPSISPTDRPTTVMPSQSPTVVPSLRPSTVPTTAAPTDLTPRPTVSDSPSDAPSISPTEIPTLCPSGHPSVIPSATPTVVPTSSPTVDLTVVPSTVMPSLTPTNEPTTLRPSVLPSIFPSNEPSHIPSEQPSLIPSKIPSRSPTNPMPTVLPTIKPTVSPTQGVTGPTTSAPSPAATGPATSAPSPAVNQQPVARRRLSDMPPASVIGMLDSTMHLIPGSNNNIYASTDFKSTFQFYYINTTSRAVIHGEQFRKAYFKALNIQYAFSYSICNENNTYSTNLDISLSSSFKSACGEKNGYYYQLNKIFDVPDSCLGAMESLSADTVNQLLTCPDVVAMRTNFTDYYCSESFDTVCSTAYTDNPPFSCSRSIRSYITIVANSFSNASLVGTVLLVLIHFTLKRVYPNGILYAHGVKNKADGDKADETPLETISSSSKKKMFGFQMGIKYSPIHPSDASKESHLHLHEIFEEDPLSDDGNDHAGHSHVEMVEDREGLNSLQAGVAKEDEGFTGDADDVIVEEGKEDNERKNDEDNGNRVEKFTNLAEVYPE